MVDPSSPLSGGAILGDRLRMDDRLADRGVFVRSLATRGQEGGLSSAVPAALRLLERAGFGLVVVETAGVGQVEVAVARSADTTVVVVTPGWGDAIQANKAGLLELADLLVVNKGDRPGADDARRDLELMLDLGAPGGGAAWRPPVVTTTATDGRGVEELWRAAEEHLVWLEASGRRGARRADAIRSELRERALVALGRMLDDHLVTGAGAELIGAVAAGSLTPVAAARSLVTATASREGAETPHSRRSTAQVKG
jgi:LAO/AO transport system kinase